jgi:nucleoside-diphosphate-sugar epimerase
MIPTGGRRIVLIGGAGFIGHNLAIELRRRGADVSVIDALKTNNLLSFAAPEDEPETRRLYLRVIRQRLELLRTFDIPLYTQDARDEQGFARCVRGLRPEVVIHLAGVSHARRSNERPHEAFAHTLQTVENALEYTRDTVEHFVYFSSSMVYGDFRAGIVDEETPCDPIGVYGALKLGGEKLVVAHHQVFDMPYTIIRPSALYGQRCVSRRVIQVFLENAMRGRDLVVSGDGTARLDFTYIDDLVQGVVRTIECEAGRNQVFNLTYGRARSVADVINQIAGAFPGLRVHYLPRNELMPQRGTLSTDKARRLLGYEPQFPLERGLPAYLAWYRDLESAPSTALPAQPEKLAAAGP